MYRRIAMLEHLFTSVIMSAMVRRNNMRTDKWLIKYANTIG